MAYMPNLFAFVKMNICAKRKEWLKETRLDQVTKSFCDEANGILELSLITKCIELHTCQSFLTWLTKGPLENRKI